MKFLRLIEINNKQELAIIKLAFNQGDIEYRTLFENTLQTGDIYALGNTGAIIEVAEKDLAEAKIILADLGMELDYDSSKDRFNFINKFDKRTQNIPWIGNLQLEFRLVTIVFATLLVLFSALTLHILRIYPNELAGNFWCVDKIIHHGELVNPNTTSGIVMIGANREKCQEEIWFRKTGVIELPGFGTRNTMAHWQFKNRKTLTINFADEFKDIYEGVYKINSHWDGTMDLISEKTTITISSR